MVLKLCQYVEFEIFSHIHVPTWEHTGPEYIGEFGRPKTTPNSRLPWEVQFMGIELVYSKTNIQ